MHPITKIRDRRSDVEALERFDDDSAARDEMLTRTDHDDAPWTIVSSNGKRRARFESIRFVLDSVPYRHSHRAAVGAPDPHVVVPARVAMQRSWDV